VIRFTQLTRHHCRSRDYAGVVAGTGSWKEGLRLPDGRTLYACVAPDFFEAAQSAAREGSLVASRVAMSVA